MTALMESTGQLKALADPTRLRILNLLGDGELCVCHLVEILDEAQPKISRHLAILRRAGLVSARVEGPWRHYALPAKQDPLTAKLLACLKSSLGQMDELGTDLERLSTLRTDGACGEAARS